MHDFQATLNIKDASYGAAYAWTTVKTVTLWRILQNIAA